jgi:transposase-like protein
MTPRRFNPTEVAEALQALEAGVTAPEVCRRFGMSELTLTRWRQKAGLLARPADPLVPVALDAQQAANRVAALELRLEAFRKVLVMMLEPGELEEAAQLLQRSLSTSARRARNLLGLPTAGTMGPARETQASRVSPMQAGALQLRADEM